MKSGVSIWNLLEKYFIYSTRLINVSSASTSPHAGMAVPGTPCLMVRCKSSFRGRALLGVERNLKIPKDKSLGNGRK